MIIWCERMYTTDIFIVLSFCSHLPCYLMYPDYVIINREYFLPVGKPRPIDGVNQTSCEWVSIWIAWQSQCSVELPVQIQIFLTFNTI